MGREEEERRGRERLGLTPAEQQTLALIATGVTSNAALAEAMGVTDKTAGNRVYSVLVKVISEPKGRRRRRAAVVAELMSRGLVGFSPDGEVRWWVKERAPSQVVPR